MEITFLSFGIKNGIPNYIDTFLDVRVLPNPFWVPELRNLTGEDEKAIQYMESFPITKETITSMIKYLDNLFEIVKQQNERYVVGICCTGGQHRSIYVANLLTKYYSKKYTTKVVHRDKK